MELSEVKLTYMQEPDSADNGDVQLLEVCVIDAGAGMYCHISTNRWAVDSMTELATQFNRISQALKELGVNLADDQTTDRS